MAVATAAAVPAPMTNQSASTTVVRDRPSRLTWRSLAYICALMVTAGIGYLLMHVPIEGSEISENFLWLHGAPTAFRMAIDPFVYGFSSSGYLRPLSDASTKLVFDVSGGHEFLAYRSLHIALVATLLLLLVRMSDVRSGPAFAAAALAMAVLVGIHPFHEAVRETELNIKLLVPACSFVAVALSMSEHRLWKDVAAVVLTFYGAFSNELGLLVWVCLAAAWIVGFRGISRRAVSAATVVLGGYFFFRFVIWDVGTPPLSERSSGFGFTTRDPTDLIAMFGGNPLPLYAYNVLASWLTVLFTEPRGGVFVLTRQSTEGSVQLSLLRDVVTSALTTMVMAWFVLRRAPSWLRRDVNRVDGVFLVSMAVLAANAAISFPYAKEVVMSTGAAFYAVACFVAMHELIVRLARPMAAWRAGFACALFLVISVGWTIRAAGFVADMRRAAYRAQTDWVDARIQWDARLLAQPGAAALMDRLRAESLAMPVPKIYREPRWSQQWLDPLH